MKKDKLFPLLAAAALVIGLIAIVALPYLDHVEAVRNCQTNMHFYNTFQAVLHAVENPPTLAGHKASPQQLSALHAYADNLRSALGSAPACRG